jgi:hypothetical protein
MFAPDEPVGGAQQEVAAPSQSGGDVVQSSDTTPTSSESQPASAAEIDWAKRVNEEWGGEQAIVSALELQAALQTREGVDALFREAGRALGIGDAALDALFVKETPSSEQQALSVDDLLADPERVLTAGEIQAILDARERQAQVERAAAAAEEQLRMAIDSTLNSLQVTDPSDRKIVLALADEIIGTVTHATKPEAVDQAIRTAHARWQAKVQQEAQTYVQTKHAAHEQLPSPLPSGSGAGGEVVPPPSSLEEAKRRTREQFRAALSNTP